VYSILLKEDNNLTVTTKERIMQRSKLVDNMRFVVEPMYKDEDMSTFDATVLYTLPVSRQPRSERLVLDEEKYNDFLVYKMPFDTNLTAEAGRVEMWLTFVKAEMDAEGIITQKVRKTSSCFVDIIPVSTWTTLIPDEALDAIDQRLLVANAQIKALEEMGNISASPKADNIAYDKDTNILQLMSNGTPIGDVVDISELANEQGILAVDFSLLPDEPEDDIPVDSNVVDF
jgi:hypothetical protein